MCVFYSVSVHAFHSTCIHVVNDAAKEEKGNDLLFTVIAEIVTAHNMAIKAMYTVIQASDQSTLARLLPEQPAQVLPTEVNQHNCLTGKSTRYVIYTKK